MPSGKIVKFDQKKGYGFIKVGSERDEIFFHRSAIVGDAAPVPFSSVSFEVKKGEKGLQAINVRITAAPPANPYAFFLGAAIFIAAATVWILATTTTLPLWLTIAIALNVATYLLCGFDKGSAGTNSARVPEWVLLGVAACGGAAGLVLGIKSFRHKRRKPGFVGFAVLLLLAQLAVIMYAKQAGIISIRP